MVELVRSISEVIENVRVLEGFRSGTPREKQFHARRIKNGKLFVALREKEKMMFAPSKFAGYKDNDIDHENELDNRDGRLTNRRMIELVGQPYDKGDSDYKQIDDLFLSYCEECGIIPSAHHRARRYWVVNNLAEADRSAYSPEEISDPTVFFEGAVQQVFVNRYERNLEARRACIDHHGYKCDVCQLILEDVYGEIGKGFIQVHHIIPLSRIQHEYQIDPITDLRPVCPNCHAMLHRGTPTMSIEELKRCFTKRRMATGR